MPLLTAHIKTIKTPRIYSAPCKSYDMRCNHNLLLVHACLTICSATIIYYWTLMVATLSAQELEGRRLTRSRWQESIHMDLDTKQVLVSCIEWWHETKMQQDYRKGTKGDSQQEIRSFYMRHLAAYNLIVSSAYSSLGLQITTQLCEGQTNECGTY